MKLPLPLLLSLVLLASTTVPAGADEAADLDARIGLLARPASAERMAEFARNLYESLLARGFGQEQAMRLVVAFASAGPGGCDGVGEP